MCNFATSGHVAFAKPVPSASPQHLLGRAGSTVPWAVFSLNRVSVAGDVLAVVKDKATHDFRRNSDSLGQEAPPGFS